MCFSCRIRCISDLGVFSIDALDTVQKIDAVIHPTRYSNYTRELAYCLVTSARYSAFFEINLS